MVSRTAFQKNIGFLAFQVLSKPSARKLKLHCCLSGNSINPVARLCNCEMSDTKYELQFRTSRFGPVILAFFVTSLFIIKGENGD